MWQIYEDLTVLLTMHQIPEFYICNFILYSLGVY